jgi:hypothetical protein
MDRELTGVRHSYFEEKKRAEAAEAKYREEHAIVDRVWKALGITSYEQTGGKEISELVTAAIRERDEALARVKELERQAIADFGQIQTALEERDEARKENAALREIVSKCASAVGAYAHPECSLDFMALVPDEVSRARASSNREGGEE